MVNVKDFGADENDDIDDAPAIRAAIRAAAGKRVELAGATYKIKSGLTVPADRTIVGGTFDASELVSGAAVTVTAAGTGAIPSRKVLERVTIVLHDSPSDGVHSTTTDGVMFQTFNVSTDHLTIVGARNGVTYDSNSWSVTHYNPAFWYCGRAIFADADGLSNMGAGLRFHHPEIAHCDFAVYNRLCEVTMIDPSFDSAVKGYVEDNITGSGGFNNSEMVLVNPRFEAGGSVFHPWIKNSGLLTMRNPAFYGPATYSYLIDNAGTVSIAGGFSRIVGDAYTSRNTEGGVIGVAGIKLVEPAGSTLRLTRETSRVADGGFESGTAGWTQTFGSVTISRTTSSPTPYAGWGALMIKNGAGAGGVRSGAVSLTPGMSTVHVTVMNRGEGTQRALAFEFYDAVGNVVEDSGWEYLAVGTAWTRLRHVQAIPAGAAYMRMRIDMGGSETIYLDEFYVSEW